MLKALKLKINRWKKILLPYLAIYLAFPLLRLILWTCRHKVHGLDRYVETAATEPTLLILWHDRLAPVIPLMAIYAPQFRYAPVVSDSRDGHLISKVINRLSAAETIDVPHDGRPHALKAIVKTLREKKAVVVITPDGPRGPRHRAKEGTAIAARLAKATLVPITWEASSCWYFSSWDKLAIPKPFSRLDITFGEPFQPLPEDDIERLVVKIEASLNRQ